MVIVAVADLLLDGSAALVFYSFLFMRWSLAITPANYPLLVCHASNEVVQLVQLGRWANAYTHPPSCPAVPSCLRSSLTNSCVCVCVSLCVCVVCVVCVVA
jgi:hypothetical protein